MADYLLLQRSVLGCVLIDQDTAGDVVTTLRPEDFSDETARKTFLAIRSLYLSDEKIDAATVLCKMGPPSPDHEKYLLEIMQVRSTRRSYRTNWPPCSAG